MTDGEEYKQYLVPKCNNLIYINHSIILRQEFLVIMSSRDGSDNFSLVVTFPLFTHTQIGSGPLNNK